MLFCFFGVSFVHKFTGLIMIDCSMRRILSQSVALFASRSTFACWHVERSVKLNPYIHKLRVAFFVHLYGAPMMVKIQFRA